jgi:hypothetical protein
MAKRALCGVELTTEAMNSGKSYRVKFSYGVFSIAAKVTQSGVYYSVVKRHKGRLYKVYAGKCGEITHELLHQATMMLQAKVYAASGDWFLQDNRSRGSSPAWSGESSPKECVPCM